MHNGSVKTTFGVGRHKLGRARLADRSRPLYDTQMSDPYYIDLERISIEDFYGTLRKGNIARVV